MKVYRTNRTIPSTPKAVPVPPTPGRHVFRGAPDDDDDDDEDDGKTRISNCNDLQQAPPLSPISGDSNRRSLLEQHAHLKRLAMSRKLMTSAAGNGISQPMTAAHASQRGPHYGREVSALPPEETNHVAMVKGRPFNRVKSEITQVGELYLAGLNARARPNFQKQLSATTPRIREKYD